MEDNFGDKLRFWRKKMTFSQNELAQKSGVSPVTIGQIETGKRKARRQTMQKLLNGLGITDEQFYGISQEQPAPVQPVITAAAPAGMAKTAANQTAGADTPVILSNLDLEIINRTLNLTFDGKLSLLKYLKALG